MRVFEIRSFSAVDALNDKPGRLLPVRIRPLRVRVDGMRRRLGIFRALCPVELLHRSQFELFGFCCIVGG